MSEGTSLAMAQQTKPGMVRTAIAATEAAFSPSDLQV
jgi:hypothetical protein